MCVCVFVCLCVSECLCMSVSACVHNNDFENEHIKLSSFARGKRRHNSNKLLLSPIHTHALGRHSPQMEEQEIKKNVPFEASLGYRVNTRNLISDAITSRKKRPPPEGTKMSACCQPRKKVEVKSRFVTKGSRSELQLFLARNVVRSWRQVLTTRVYI